MHVIGHRGAAGLMPENTLGSFRRAIELGVDAVECDVRRTRDGHLVVLHDATLDRTTTGSGPVAEMDLAAVRALDAGGGEPVPMFDELLDLLHGRCGLVCEIKADGAAAPAVQAVGTHDMLDATTFVSFKLDHLREVLQAEPSATAGWILVDPSDADLSQAAAAGMQLVCVEHRHVQDRAVQAARELGLAVTTWTPNEPADMRRAIAMGVDGITTDRPDVLLDLLGDR